MNLIYQIAYGHHIAHIQAFCGCRRQNTRVLSVGHWLGSLTCTVCLTVGRVVDLQLPDIPAAIPIRRLNQGAQKVPLETLGEKNTPTPNTMAPPTAMLDGRYDTFRLLVLDQKRQRN